MDPNSTNYTGANAGGTAGGGGSLGAGADSISVTGTGAGQNAGSGAYQPSQGGSQGTQGDLGGAQHAAHNLGDRLSDAKDQAADKLSQARDMAGERLGQAREKATELKATLADKLDQGAQSLRQQAQGQQFAGANGATAAVDDGLRRYAAPAANAMEKTADFLRDGDLKAAIEEQVRTAPGRTLLIAVGLGYLLGKAIRR